MGWFSLVLCTLETGVVAAAISFKWHRKWTDLLKLNVFGHFRWCELHLVSPILKRSLVVGMRDFSRWGSLPGEEVLQVAKMAQRQGNFAEWSEKPPTVCTSLLVPTGTPNTVVAEAALKVKEASLFASESQCGLGHQGQNCCPLAVIFIFSY